MGFIIGTVQSLSIVKDQDFINMINGFNQHYNVPYIKILKDRILLAYEIGKDTLKNQLIQVQDISLTLDA